jgi:hypothetical protein
MTAESDGFPAIGDSARVLGARSGTDIPVDEDGLVRPGEGGISVSADDPMYLPRFRRPLQLDGTGKDPVWSVNQQELGEDLSFRPDPRNPTHGFIEPARVMTFERYQEALHKSRRRWRLVT